MKLMPYFIKLTLKKNYKHYFQCTLYLFASIVLMTMLTTLIENIKTGYGNVNAPSQYIMFKLGSFETVFNIAVVSFVLYRYYKITDEGIAEYRVFKALGASRSNLRILALFQSILLMTLTVPIGLYLGVTVSGFLGSFVMGMVSLEYNCRVIDLTSILQFIVAVTILSIIIIGFAILRGIEKKLPPQIYTRIHNVNL